MSTTETGQCITDEQQTASKGMIGELVNFANTDNGSMLIQIK